MRAVESAVAGGDLAAVDAPVDDSVRISTSLSARDTPSMRAEVMRYLINDGFSVLGVGGTLEAPKPAGDGCTFVQPVAICPDGDTRLVFGAGFKEVPAVDRRALGPSIRLPPALSVPSDALNWPRAKRAVRCSRLAGVRCD